MTQVYSTAELIEILAQERQACMRGERLQLQTQLSGNPLIDRFLAAEGVQKFTAYEEFRRTVHHYQQDYGVSGIVWEAIAVHGETLHYPTIHDQLIALPQDLEQLQAAKPRILQFWHQVTVAMDIFIADNRQYQPLPREEVIRIAQRTEWALIWKWENATFLQVLLQLGWGQPPEASYQRSLPHSGSRSIHAVNPGMRPIG